MSQFQTDKNDITKTRLVMAADTPEDFALQDGDILVALERFAFTANNVTYGAVGEQIGYWQFFPPHLAANDDPDWANDADWGCVPVWGFAKVVVSKQPDIEVGERLYGYFPMSDYLQITPTRISAQRLIDGAPHRAQLPEVYNNYERLGKNAGDTQADNLRALLNPLYGTSFCLCDALQAENYYDAQQVVIVSASSKTAIGLAYGLAHALAQSGDTRPKIIGLTSPTNVEFVRSTGVYDEVIGYDALANLENVASVLVDMSGNRVVLGAVHAALGDNMRWCHNVGLTHWDDSDTKNSPEAEKIIRDRSAMFFAPAHIQRRASEWGAVEFNAKVAAFLSGGMAQAEGWMQVKEIAGLQAFAPIYDAVVAGKIKPEEGLIVTF